MAFNCRNIRYLRFRQAYLFIARNFQNLHVICVPGTRQDTVTVANAAYLNSAITMLQAQNKRGSFVKQFKAERFT